MSSPDTKPNAATLELVAFTLFSLNELGNSEHAWRQVDESVRQRFRGDAKALVQQVETYGIEVRAAKPQRVKASLDQLVTIPAKPAYELPAD